MRNLIAAFVVTAAASTSAMAQDTKPTQQSQQLSSQPQGEGMYCRYIWINNKPVWVCS